MVSCVACGLSQNARKIGITFHRFPKKAELCEAWIKFVNKPTTNIPKFAVLCSQHFEESDFDRSTFKVLLKPNAMPSKIIQRHKYERISSDEFTPSVSKGHSQTVTTTIAATSAEPMDAQQKILQSFNNPVTDLEVCLTTLKEVKLQQQIRHLANVNIKQSHQIRKLQKRTWSQKKRIFQLTSALKELEKRNLINPPLPR